MALTKEDKQKFLAMANCTTPDTDLIKNTLDSLVSESSADLTQLLTYQDDPAIGNALHIACRLGHIDVAKLLLSYGAIVDDAMLGLIDDKYPKLYALIKINKALQSTLYITHRINLARTIMHLTHATKTMSVLNSRTDGTALYVAGDTRTGKSTFINYICGTDYEYDDTSRKMKVAGASLPESAPVGRTGISKTLYPGLYSIPGAINNFFVDMAGFHDNRVSSDTIEISPYQIASDMANHILTQKIKAFKLIIFTVEAQHLESANINTILKPLKILCRLIGECSLDKIVLMITKKDMASRRYAFKPSLLTKCIETIESMEIEPIAQKETMLQLLRYWHDNSESAVMESDIEKSDFRIKMLERIGQLTTVAPASTLNFGDYSLNLKRLHALILEVDDFGQTLITQLQQAIKEQNKCEETLATLKNEYRTMIQSLDTKIDITSEVKLAEEKLTAISDLSDALTEVTTKITLVRYKCEMYSEMSAGIDPFREVLQLPTSCYQSMHGPMPFQTHKRQPASDAPASGAGGVAPEH